MYPRGASPVFEAALEVALVSPRESNRVSLRTILERSQSTVQCFATYESALAFLHEHPVGVVIADEELAEGCWKDLLETLSGFVCPPILIVSTRTADERLWAEVLNLGGYDVLPTPFEPDEVMRVCTGAWLAWKHRSTEKLAVVRYSGL